MLFRVVCIVSAQNFDKDRLYTKIDQHRFWQNTKTWGPFLLPVPYKSWATFYAVNLFLMMHRQMNWNCNQAMIITKLIINLGGDSGGGGGGAELANRGMSPWTGYCQCFSHLAHDLVQVLFLLLHHTRRCGRCLSSSSGKAQFSQLNNFLFFDSFDESRTVYLV